ncbi:hypothetical protein A4H97_08915 [Niastella yeongjuensis]|uniref:Uncharacterized protein n=1 Tax=Niastella yeongjuensis TaxID=354355 RepID=A0A1V9EEB8_9BACT|nr:hypothetical protein A4H97_08915 [Niastella yeongjuensis]
MKVQASRLRQLAEGRVGNFAINLCMLCFTPAIEGFKKSDQEKNREVVLLLPLPGEVGRGPTAAH